MPEPLLTKLADWNPQLWREMKGRVQWRSAIATVAASLGTQFLLVMFFQQRGIRPVALFQTLSWMGLFLLLLLGNYLLVKNIAQEDRQGTLSFLRLTPHPAGKILLGKLLGVPILLHLAIGLAIPLHFWSARQAGLSCAVILSMYLIALVVSAVSYNFTLLYAVSWGAKARAWYIVVLICGFYPFLMALWGLWLILFTREAESLIFSLFLLVFPILFTLGCWKASVHRFHHPPALFTILEPHKF